MEAVLDGDDARAPGGGAADLDRRLDRLGARAREQDASEPARRALEQRLGERARGLRDPERDPAGELEVERLVQRRPDARVGAADVVHPEAAEHVQEAVAVRVVEVGALAAGPVPVEADRPQHAQELRVDRAPVQLELAARALLDERADAEVAHALSLARVILVRMSTPEGWSEVDGALQREFRFPDFAEALAFVNRVGELAEAENHHPDIELGWGRVAPALADPLRGRDHRPRPRHGSSLGRPRLAPRGRCGRGSPRTPLNPGVRHRLARAG